MTALRNAFVLGRMALVVDDLVFIDEFGSNLAMVPHYGRARAGKRVRTSRPTRRGKNVTFAGAMTRAGLIALADMGGSATTERFLAWVQSHLVPVLRKGQVVILDNLRAHHAEEVRAAIEAVGARLEFLPPYSPEYNPIEECWSKVKTYLRRVRARTREALVAAVQEARQLVTSGDAHGWFRHAGYA